MTNSNQAHKGAILRQTREARGITLDAVHEATKVPMDALKAIEEGYNVRILTPFYYRAFIKKYAQYLGIAPESILDDTPDLRKENRPPKSAVISSTAPFIRKIISEPKPSQAKGSSSNDLMQKISLWLTRRRQQQIVGAIGLCLALLIALKIIIFVKNIFLPPHPRPAVSKPQAERKVKNLNVAQKKNPARPAVAVVKAVPAVNTASAQQTDATEKPASVKLADTATQGGPINLTVRAKRNSWLQVRSDGIVVFQSTLNKGDVENWAADNKIEISGKNVNDLEFELNGKLISSLGKSDRQARRLIVTKDGLSIKD